MLKTPVHGDNICAGKNLHLLRKRSFLLGFGFKSECKHELEIMILKTLPKFTLFDNSMTMCLISKQPTEMLVGSFVHMYATDIYF